MKKTILVIGSNSFSGANFINYLLQKKHKVIGVSRSIEINSIFLPYKTFLNINKNFKFYKCDLNKHTNKIIRIIENNKIQFIINFASQGMVEESWKYPIDWYNTNLISQIKLIEKIKKFKFIKKYVHVSTPEVYGNIKNLISENELFNPSTPYAASRAACEHYLNNCYKNYNFPLSITRAANVYGPTQQLYRIIPRTIMCILTNKKLNLHGGGKSIRSFIHIKDVAEATYLIMFKSKIGESYNISTDEYITIKDLVKLICKKMNKNYNKIIKNTSERMGKDHSYYLNSKKIKKELNFKNKYNISSGIDETIEWVIQNIKSLKKQNRNYIHKK